MNNTYNKIGASVAIASALIFSPAISQAQARYQRTLHFIVDGQEISIKGSDPFISSEPMRYVGILGKRAYIYTQTEEQVSDEVIHKINRSIIDAEKEKIRSGDTKFCGPKGTMMPSLREDRIQQYTSELRAKTSPDAPHGSRGLLNKADEVDAIYEILKTCPNFSELQANFKTPGMIRQLYGWEN